MIYHFLPYTTDNNYSKCLNDYCSMVPQPDDWIVIWDYDTLRTDPEFGKEIEAAIKLNQDFDLLTVKATRSVTASQMLNEKISYERDLITLHKMCSAAKKNGLRAKVTNEPVAGFMHCFRKSLWDQFPFFEVPGYGGIMGIDYYWGEKLLRHKKRIGVIPGIAIIHYYRLHKKRRDCSHLFIRDGKVDKYQMENRREIYLELIKQKEENHS